MIIQSVKAMGLLFANWRECVWKTIYYHIPNYERQAIDRQQHHGVGIVGFLWLGRFSSPNVTRVDIDVR